VRQKLYWEEEERKNYRGWRIRKRKVMEQKRKVKVRLERKQNSEKRRRGIKKIEEKSRSLKIHR